MAHAVTKPLHVAQGEAEPLPVALVLAQVLREKDEEVEKLGVTEGDAETRALLEPLANAVAAPLKEADGEGEPEVHREGLAVPLPVAQGLRGALAVSVAQAEAVALPQALLVGGAEPVGKPVVQALAVL